MCQGLFGTCLFGRRDISTHAGRQQEGGRREGEEREGRELEREGGQGRQGTLDSKHLIQNNMQETVLPLLAPRRRATAVGWRTIAPVMTHRVSRPCRRHRRLKHTTCQHQHPRPSPTASPPDPVPRAVSGVVAVSVLVE